MVSISAPACAMPGNMALRYVSREASRNIAIN
jgi:hypothetical protein